MVGDGDTPAGALVGLWRLEEAFIVDENDRHQRLFTDFRGISVSASGGAQPQAAVAGWEGDVLVVESRMNHGSRSRRKSRMS